MKLAASSKLDPMLGKSPSGASRGKTVARLELAFDALPAALRPLSAGPRARTGQRDG
jgi:hypothetical protein